MSPTPAAPQSTSGTAPCRAPALNSFEHPQGLTLPTEFSQWFTSEVHPHGAQLKSYLRAAFPGVRDVDDVVQESYLRVWKLRATQRIQSAKGILFTVARHVALDLLRRKRGSPVEAVADLAGLRAVEEKADPAEALDGQHKVMLLAKALAALPERTREIVVLRKFQGLSQKEVASRLGTSEAAIEHQVARGLKKCEAHLRKLGIASLYDE